MASKLQEPENTKQSVFPETTAFGKYGAKTSEKVNVHNRTGLMYLNQICSLCIP